MRVGRNARTEATDGKDKHKSFVHTLMIRCAVSTDRAGGGWRLGYLEDHLASGNGIGNDKFGSLWSVFGENHGGSWLN